MLPAAYCRRSHTGLRDLPLAPQNYCRDQRNFSQTRGVESSTPSSLRSVRCGQFHSRRVRSKISKAIPQLKAATKGRFRGLLVLLDMCLVAKHTSSYYIRVAMQGFETYYIGVPQNPSQPVYLKRKDFGSGKKTLQVTILRSLPLQYSVSTMPHQPCGFTTIHIPKLRCHSRALESMESSSMACSPSLRVRYRIGRRCDHAAVP